MSDEGINLTDNFGCHQKLKEILPHSHYVDIRVRYNGRYYWFEGDFIKYILKHVNFIKGEPDINCVLESHAGEAD